MSNLIITRREGETIVIDERITIKVVGHQGAAGCEHPARRTTGEKEDWRSLKGLSVTATQDAWYRQSASRCPHHP